jgi:hypothetical protein
MEEYYQSYKPPEIIISKKFGIQKDQIILGFTITCMFAIALTLAFSKTE